MSLSEQPPSRAQIALLLFSIFIVALCGLTYELLSGAVSSYLLGNSVLWFSLTIGGFMTAMGIGAWLSRTMKEALLERFIAVEVLVGMIGGLAGPLLFGAYTWTQGYVAALFVFVGVIGIGVGLEIPLLTRYLEQYGGLRKTISDVMSVDYAGALGAALLFPLVLLPYLGLMKTFPAIGLLNLSVAAVTIFAFRRRLKNLWWLSGATAIGIALMVGVMVVSEQWMSRVESSLYTDQILYAEQSSYQRIVMTRYKDDTRLFIDGHLQLSSRDEYRYHETLVHPAMTMSANRERVLVLGGGDGMAVREILKYPDVKEVTLVDLDPVMTRLGTEHPALTELNQRSMHDPRVTVVNGDGYQFLEKSSDLWSVIIIDFPDPHGEALAKLYSVHFYGMVRRGLSPGGIAVTQSTSPYFAREAFWCIEKTVEIAQMNALPYHVWVPSFGEWGFMLMSGTTLDVTRLNMSVETKWLDSSVIRGMFDFPSDMSRVEVDHNRLTDPVILQYYGSSWSKWF